MAQGIFVNDEVYILGKPEGKAAKDIETYTYDEKTWRERLYLDEWDTIDNLTILGPRFYPRQKGIFFRNVQTVQFGQKKIDLAPRALANSKLKHVVFPGNVDFSTHVLANCPELESVFVDCKKKHQVPEGSFMGDRKLKSVKFNPAAEITYFGPECFKDCESLTLEIPETVYHIGAFAMAGVGGNRELRIPMGCTKIEDYAFADMNIERVIIENPNVNIPMSAFSECKNIKSVQIGDKIYPVDFYWRDCPMLTKETECVHGIDVTTIYPITGNLDDKDGNVYVAQFAGSTRMGTLRRDAIRGLRYQVMQEKYKQMVTPKLGCLPTDRFVLKGPDISLQEAFCLGEGAVPVERWRFVMPLDCDNCQEKYPNIYQECMHRYGFDKKQH